MTERRAPAAGPIRSGAGSCKTARSLEAQRRRVVAAKALLREARAENEQLRSKLALLLDDPGPAAAPVRQQAATEPDSSMRQGLYIGGRIKAQAQLRRGAESCRACLSFHDGGMEKNLQGLDDLVAQADMVFCPMDCVSHGACVLAKRLCRRFEKPFVPLRTSSSSHFRTVAARIAATIDGKSELPAIVTIGLREGEKAACS